MATNAIGSNEFTQSAAVKIAIEIFRNQDTTHIDTSDVGAWFTNNLGATAATDWSAAEKNQMRRVIGLTGDTATANANWGILYSDVLTAEVNTKTGFKLAQDGLDTDTSFTNLQTVAQGIKTKTDNLPADPCDDSDVDGQLLAIDNYVDTEIAAIKAKTDLLAFSTKGVKSAVRELDEDSATIDLDGTTVNASCAGSGLRTVNVYVKNSADSTGVRLYTVSIVDSSAGADQGRATTDESGLSTWNLDDGTYIISMSAAGWEITSPETLYISANTDTTYYATQYSPTPPSAEYCTIYAYTYRLTGARSGCRLQARIPPEYGVVTSATFLTIPYVAEDTSEADGKVELNVLRSTNLTSSAGLTPVKMLFKLFDLSGNAVVDTLMEVPDQASKKIW